MDVRVNGELKKLELFDLDGEDIAATYLADSSVNLQATPAYNEPVMAPDDYLLYADDFAKANKILEEAKALPEYFHSWAKDVANAQCDEKFLYSTLDEGLETWKKMAPLRAISNGERPASDAAKKFAKLVLDAHPVDEEDLTEVIEQEKFDMPRKYNKPDIDKAAVECDVYPQMNESAKKWYMKRNPTDELGEELTDMTFKEVYMQIMNGQDIYKTMNIGASDIREALMQELVERSDTSYDILYDQWLHNSKAPAKEETPQKPAAQTNDAMVQKCKDTLMTGLKKVQLTMREKTGNDKDFNKMMKQILKELAADKTAQR